MIKPHGYSPTPITYGITSDLVSKYVKPDIIVVAIDDLLKVVKRVRVDEVWSKRMPQFTIEDASLLREESIKTLTI